MLKPNGDMKPSAPLILSAWDHTTEQEKQLRFKEHVQWAYDNNQIDEVGTFLRSFKEEEWYHFGERFGYEIT